MVEFIGRAWRERGESFSKYTTMGGGKESVELNQSRPSDCEREATETRPEKRLRENLKLLHISVGE